MVGSQAAQNILYKFVITQQYIAYNLRLQIKCCNMVFCSHDKQVERLHRQSTNIIVTVLIILFSA